MIPITLKTKRLLLKPLTSEYSNDYQKYFNNFEVLRFLGDVVSYPYPSDGAYDYIKKVVEPAQGRTEWHWGIFLKTNSSELIGTICLRTEPDAETNRGFWLGEPFWRNGYMTEASTAVNEFAFNQLDMKILRFANAVGNDGSRRIKEKTGAKFLGTSPAKFVDKNLDKQENWQLTRESWRSFRT